MIYSYSMQMRKYSTHLRGDSEKRAEKRGSKGTLLRAATTGTGAPTPPQPSQSSQPLQQLPSAAHVPALEQTGEASPGEEEAEAMAMAREMGARDEGCVQMVLKLIARMCDGQNSELQVLWIGVIAWIMFRCICYRARFHSHTWYIRKVMRLLLRKMHNI